MSDEQAIKNTILKWVAASKEGNLHVLEGILDDDMLFTVPGRAPFGKKEFLAGGSGKPHRFDANVSILEVIVNGDWALTRIYLDVDLAATEDAKVIHLAGPAMAVWRKASGENWQLWRDANMVAPTTASG